MTRESHNRERSSVAKGNFHPAVRLDRRQADNVACRTSSGTSAKMEQEHSRQRSLTAMQSQVYGSFERGNELREIAVSTCSSSRPVVRTDRPLKVKTRRNASSRFLFPGPHRDSNYLSKTYYRLVALERAHVS